MCSPTQDGRGRGGETGGLKGRCEKVLHPGRLHTQFCRLQGATESWQAAGWQKGLGYRVGSRAAGTSRRAREEGSWGLPGPGHRRERRHTEPLRCSPSGLWSRGGGGGLGCSREAGEGRVPQKGPCSQHSQGADLPPETDRAGELETCHQDRMLGTGSHTQTEHRLAQLWGWKLGVIC